MHPLLVGSLVLVIIAVIALIVLLAMSLPAIKRTVTIINTHAEGMQKGMGELNTQKALLMTRVDALKNDVGSKSQAIQSAVGSFKETAETVKQLQFSAKHLTSTMVNEVSNREETKVMTEQYSDMAMGILNKNMRRKKVN